MWTIFLWFKTYKTRILSSVARWRKDRVFSLQGVFTLRLFASGCFYIACFSLQGVFTLRLFASGCFNIACFSLQGVFMLRFFDARRFYTAFLCCKAFLHCVLCNGYCDMTEFLKDTKNDIHGIIVEELGIRGALKFYLTVRPQLSRSDPDGNEAISTPYLCSLPCIVLAGSDILKQIVEAGDRIKELLEIHEGHGSGFKLDCILDCQLNIASYDNIGGSTYTPMAKYIQSKKATVNIKVKTTNISCTSSRTLGNQSSKMLRDRHNTSKIWTALIFPK